MTSRQPRADPGTPEAESRSALSGTALSWTLVLPVALLLLLGLAGLRGVVIAPRWNGPFRQDSLAIGLALEAVLGILLIGMIRRRSGAQRAARFGGAALNEVAVKLRGALIVALAGVMAAVAVGIDNHLHLHVSTHTIPTQAPHSRSTISTLKPDAAHHFHLPLADVLYGVLIVVLVVAVLISVWWARRFRRPVGRTVGDDDLIAEDPEELREAVGSGRSALRLGDDARAAIIACYVAMEDSLARRGTARGVADTPDELLARVQMSGLVRGTATARLTSLFYEARFSSHPMAPDQRDAAEQALDEIAAAL